MSIHIIDIFSFLIYNINLKERGLIFVEEEKFIEQILAPLIFKVDNKTFKMLQIAIRYYYKDVTYTQLQNMYGVSNKFVRASIHSDLIKEYLGEDFYNELQKKCHYKKQTAYRKRNLLDINILSEEELLSLSVIKNEDVDITNKRELKMLRTSILFLEEDYSYSEMSSILGYSKASISNYLTDEALRGLLKEEYYNIIQEKLASRTPAPSKSIIMKKRQLSNFIDFISVDNLTIEELRNNINIFKLAEEFGVCSSSMNYYLKDCYFEELLERRGRGKSK